MNGERNILECSCRGEQTTALSWRQVLGKSLAGCDGNITLPGDKRNKIQVGHASVYNALFEDGCAKYSTPLKVEKSIIPYLH